MNIVDAPQRDAPQRDAPQRDAPRSDAPHIQESRTRGRVLQAISEHGPVTATALAQRLGLTSTAVRRHLDTLVEGGIIASHEATAGHRGRGRPARSYVVSDIGHGALESDYDHLATEALHFLEQVAGSQAVTAFAEQRVGDMESRYAVELAAAGTQPAARTEALVAALTRDGFAASARPVGEPGSASPLTGIQLCQGHCPVQHVAAAFPQFCDAETEAFSRLLGVHVQRLATLAHGDHVCTTFIPTANTTTSTTTPSTTTPSTTSTATTTERSTR